MRRTVGLVLLAIVPMFLGLGAFAEEAAAGAAVTAASGEHLASAAQDSADAHDGCTPISVDLTDLSLRKRLEGAQFTPIGTPDVVHLSSGTKVENQQFSVLDEDGNELLVTTTCSGSCTGIGCGVSGCHVGGGSCSECWCTGCTGVPCTCTKTETE